MGSLRIPSHSTQFQLCMYLTSLDLDLFECLRVSIVLSYFFHFNKSLQALKNYFSCSIRKFSNSAWLDIFIYVLSTVKIADLEQRTGCSVLYGQNVFPTKGLKVRSSVVYVRVNNFTRQDEQFLINLQFNFQSLILSNFQSISNYLKSHHLII